MCRYKGSQALMFVASILLMLEVSQGFRLSNTLGDHMVLSRKGAMVYGFDTAGSIVTTFLDHRNFTTTTDGSGIWRQTLFSMAAGGPYVLNFTSSSGGTASLFDVLFGDVYLCGGQSNGVCMVCMYVV
jgi:sialate O-acetylesterase